jgi:glycine/D-amino acid oxidase-like deaminating enzyme
MPWKNGKLISSYVASTGPLHMEEIFGERLVIWETAVPYCYVRPGIGGNILFGGVDREVRSPLLRDILRPLAEYDLRKRADAMTFADIELKNYWSGTFAESPDGLPLLGPSPDSPRVFFIYASGGNGTLFAHIGAEMARDWITGYASEYTELFGWARLKAESKSFTQHPGENRAA